MDKDKGLKEGGKHLETKQKYKTAPVVQTIGGAIHLTVHCVLAYIKSMHESSEQEKETEYYFSNTKQMQTETQVTLWWHSGFCDNMEMLRDFCGAIQIFSQWLSWTR